MWPAVLVWRVVRILILPLRASLLAEQAWVSSERKFPQTRAGAEEDCCVRPWEALEFLQLRGCSSCHRVHKQSQYFYQLCFALMESPKGEQTLILLIRYRLNSEAEVHRKPARPVPGLVSAECLVGCQV